MRVRKPIGVLGLALFTAAGVCASAANAAQNSQETQQQINASEAFIDHAAVGGMFEVQSSQLAQKRSANSEIKAFADKMIADHTAANIELRKLVESGKVEGVAQLPSKLDSDHASKLERLNTAQESQFDKTYRDMQLRAHQDAVQLFASEAKSGQDQNLKAWATKTLPVLQRHLALIKSITIPSSSNASAANTVMPSQTNGNRKDAKELVTGAVSVVQEMKRDPQVAKLLDEAKGVYIVPDFGRAALGVGIRGGEGVMLSQANGHWTSPGFYDFGAISIGAQAGASGGSIAYILMSDKAVDEFKQTNNFSLNANAGLSVVDYSANAQGSYGKGDIVVWSDTKGLFAGVSVGVSDIGWSKSDNNAFYGGTVTPQQIFAGKGTQYSEARELKDELSGLGGSATGSSSGERGYQNDPYKK